MDSPTSTSAIHAQVSPVVLPGALPPVLENISSSVWGHPPGVWVSSGEEEEGEEEDEDEDEDGLESKSNEDKIHYPPVRVQPKWKTETPAFGRSETLGLGGLGSPVGSTAGSTANSTPGGKRENCIFCLTALKKGVPKEFLNIMNLNNRTLPSWTCIKWFQLQDPSVFTMLEKRLGAFVRNGVNQAPLIFEFEAEMLHLNSKNHVEVRIPLSSAFDTINKMDESVYLQYPGQKSFHSNIIYTSEGVTVTMTPMWNDPLLGYYGPKPYYSGQTRVWAWPVLYPLEGSQMFVQWIICTNLSVLTDSYCVPCAKKLLERHN